MKERSIVSVPIGARIPLRKTRHSLSTDGFRKMLFQKGEKMKLNIRAFAIAQTVAAAILFIVCAFFVGFLPDATMSFTKYALHADLSGIMRPFNLGGFIVGLLVTSIGWGLLSLIIASVYNSLTKNAA